MAAAFPIAKKGAFQDANIQTWTLGGSALVIDYTGTPEGSAAAHYGMDLYLKENGLTSKEPVMEEYLKQDGANSQTRIVYFVE